MLLALVSHIKLNMKKLFIVLAVVFTGQMAIAQEGVPVYLDYLTDNYYLIHPSMAGAAACGKIRGTVRQQWFDQMPLIYRH
jgi:hypothetical protein